MKRPIGLVLALLLGAVPGLWIGSRTLGSNCTAFTRRLAKVFRRDDGLVRCRWRAPTATPV